MVVWLVGLSGAGKSTIGRKLYDKLKISEPNTVFVDGDDIRAVFKHDEPGVSYTIENRRKNAERIVEICKWLDSQGLNVVCSILCIFPDILRQNKFKYKRYYEIFVSATLDVLNERDTKGLYAAASEGKISNVVGCDIPFPEPKEPNLVVDTSSKYITPDMIVKKILNMVTNDQNSQFQIARYIYSDGNRLENRNTYFYTPYLGIPFVNGWHAARQNAKNQLNISVLQDDIEDDKLGSNRYTGEFVIKTLLKEVLENRYSDTLKLLIQRFEVGKRIYDEYDKNLRPIPNSADKYCSPQLYIGFAELLSLAYSNTKELVYLNSLLKVMDILVSISSELDAVHKNSLSRIIAEESTYISELEHKVGVLPCICKM